MTQQPTSRSQELNNADGHTFETTDFYLACFLRCIGYELLNLRREGRRSIFVFRDGPERKASMMAFYNNESAVRPLAFASVIKDMKAMIHNI